MAEYLLWVQVNRVRFPAEPILTFQSRSFSFFTFTTHSLSIQFFFHSDPSFSILILSLYYHSFIHSFIHSFTFFQSRKKWSRWDSNPGPYVCKTYVIPNYTTRPYRLIILCSYFSLFTHSLTHSFILSLINGSFTILIS